MGTRRRTKEDTVRDPAGKPGEEADVVDRERRALDARDVTYAAAGVALVAVCAWVSVPVGPVPFTLQTMAVAFVALALPPRRALLAVAAYALLGAAGLPVFNAMQGGVGVLLGPTGGFVAGFVVGTALAGLAASRLEGVAGRVVACALLLAATYAMGWAWLVLSTGMGPAAAFAVACAPFVVPDVAKVAIGAALARVVGAALPALSASVGRR